MVPHAIVEVDGFQWDSWKHERLFQRVSVELATGEASEAVWELFDPDFQIIDKYSGVGAQRKGLPVIRVWLGFGQEIGEPVFKGLLARVERGEARTTFRAYDMGFKMRLIKKSGYLKGDDLDIIKQLALRNGLAFIGPAKPLKLEPHKAIAQDGQTDWEHISERAHDAGLLLWVRDDTLFADYPARTAPDDQVKSVLTYKKDFSILRNFDLRFKVPENKKGRPKGIEVRGRGRGGKRLSGKSHQGGRGHEVLLLKRDLAKHTQQAATARAEAQKELDREHAFEVSISAISQLPAARVDVRSTIWLKGLGQLFSGKYIADRVTHELAPARLTTEYELHRDVVE